MNTRSPRNTAADDPLEKFLVAAEPGGVEAQEARGQQEIVHGDTLPDDMRGGREPFEALGFTFGTFVKGDLMFRHATLPDGWRREGTSHSMWSSIVDERGMKRVSIFYKAAFYDRAAFMSIVDVGADIATGFVYGDEESFSPPSNLTGVEEAAAIKYAVQYLHQAEDMPRIYGDRAPRAQAVIDAFRTP